MITLIVNADDFGLSRGVNNGIVDSYLYGIVNSATMMMNMPGTEHAIELAKKHPGLRVGIHLVLTCGKPLLKNVPSLVDENGDFKKLSYLTRTKDLSLEELEREWTAQIERFLAAGLKPTHFDSHHHVHTMEELLPVVQRLAKRYNLAVRTNGSKKIAEVKAFSDLCLFDFYGEGVTEEYFLSLADRLEDGKRVEIMCHPAYLDNTLLNVSSYTHTRLTELDILTSVKLPENLTLL
ncbi:chitin disaccharide deacetylase [Neobacillus sp. DY30]|uniref:chitin disaccharide deacetylase n=1 Tax=Neobacillus sp. DY30 TaxID=3047871 RepID=UPI0024C03BAB|nr:chitin disaccharide deacetylase [Neobacillus sp. DY30]WHY00363.1 chitin disaccharide deacetylase [Neobacillus sp. DY30]